MKSTEIDAERVVSTSGLLTGRPNASWPRRISASPPKTNFFSLPTPPPPDICKTRQSPLLSHNISTVSTHLKICGVLTVYNAAPTQMHATQAHAHPLRGGERTSVQNKASALGDDASAWTLRPRSASVASGSAIITSEPGQLGPVEAFPTQESVLKIHHRTEKTRRCLVYRPLPLPLSSPLSNYKTNLS